MQEIFDSIKANKTRSFLTGLSIAWGVMILILLVGIGKGFETGVMKVFTGFAKKTLYISTGQTSEPFQSYPADRHIYFSSKDVSDLRSLIPEVKDISPIATQNLTVSAGVKGFRFDINGVSPGFFSIRLLRAASGRVIDPADEKDNRKVAFIGKDVAQYLFGKSNAVGQSINIGGVFFTVIGVIRGNLFNSFEAKLVYIPYSAYISYFNRDERIGLVVLSLKNETDVQKATDRIRLLMAKRYGFSSTDKSVFFFNSLDQQVKTFSSFFAGLRKFLWFMGLSTLFSGVIGVTNIMYCVAKERTREIGLRKAIGARNSAIRKLFISEAVLLCSLAGYTGMVAGALLLKLIGQFFDPGDNQIFERPHIDWRIALAASIVLTLSGALAGFMPAVFASRMNPIEALRHE